MTRTRARVLVAAAAAALLLPVTGFAAAADAAQPHPATATTPQPTPTPTSKPSTLTVHGAAAPGAATEKLQGTLRVEVSASVVDHGKPVGKAAATSYAVVTADGRTIPVTGAVPATAATGDSFSGTVSRPGTGSATPSTAGAAPAAIVDATITRPAIDVSVHHTLDLVVVNPAGVAPVDTTTYTTASLTSLAQTVGGFWAGQSTANGYVTQPVAFDTPTVTTTTSPGGCSQGIDALWDQAAVALGYTSAQNYLDANTPPAHAARNLVLLLPPACQNDWVAIGTYGDGLQTPGLIEATLGLTVDNTLIAHELGTNFGLGSSDLEFCGRLASGADCSTYYNGDPYDLMGSAFIGHDQLDDLNIRTRAALGWTTAGQNSGYYLSGTETSHTFTGVQVDPVGAAKGSLTIVDPTTQQADFLEYRPGGAAQPNSPLYWSSPVVAMDDAGQVDVLAAPGLRLEEQSADNGSVVVTHPDDNQPYNDGAAMYGKVDGSGHTTQNATVRNETGTVSVTVTGGGNGSPLIVNITLKAQPTRLHDYSGDGHPDLLARNTAGVLLSYHGNGAAGWATPLSNQVGSGWNGMTAIVASGDFDGDGFPDVLARDASGALWLYPGNGAGGWYPRSAVGSGWNIMTSIVSVGDFNGDRTADIVATDTSGRLWLYPGNGAGGWLTPSVIGTGWGGMVSLVGVGDFNGDGASDLLAEDTTGALWLYAHTPSGWLARVQVGSGWRIMTKLVSIGDVDGNGTDDIVATDTAGALWLYRGTGHSAFNGRVQIGSGWSGMTWLG